MRYRLRTLLILLALGPMVPWPVHADSKDPVAVLDGLRVPCLSITTDGSKMAVGGFTDDTEARIHVYDLATWKVSQTFFPKGVSVKALSFAPDGSRLFAAVGKDLVVWNMSEGRLLGTMSRHTDYVYGVAATPDGKQVISVGEDGRICVWDAKELAHLKDLAQYDISLDDVAINHVTGAIAVVGTNGFFRIWQNLDDKAPVSVPSGNIEYLHRVRFSPDGRFVAAVGVRGCVMATMPGERAEETKTIPFGRLMDGLAWLPNGRAIFVGCSNSVFLVSKDEGTRIRRIASGKSLVRCIELDAVNDRLFVADWSGAIKVWKRKDVLDPK